LEQGRGSALFEHQGSIGAGWAKRLHLSSGAVAIASATIEEHKRDAP
jgi:hypothetical protein